MSVRYIFNTSGEYVAFVDSKNIFSPNGNWLGFIERGNEVYDKDGQFIGYLLDDDRIVRKRNELKPRVMRPLRPIRPIRPIRPLRRLRMLRLPHPYEDVFERGKINTVD